MLRPRITPCLLVREGGLVKTVRFMDATYLGDPINAVKIFNEKEADELMVLDIDATAKGVDPDFKLIERLAVECRMPLCYGGGIHSAAQARRIIGLGVEKVAISAAAIETPQLIAELSEEIGSQSIVVVLDVKRTALYDGYEVFTHNARRATGRGALDVAREVQDLGAGEIVLNAIENDGMMRGYDLEMAQYLRRALHLPMTILGGAGSLADVGMLIQACGVIGAAAGSLFVFKGAYRAVLINYPNRAQKEELLRRSLKSE